MEINEIFDEALKFYRLAEENCNSCIDETLVKFRPAHINSSQISHNIARCLYEKARRLSKYETPDKKLDFFKNHEDEILECLSEAEMRVSSFSSEFVDSHAMKVFICNF